MNKILIFGGTTEGRQLAEYCQENQIEAYVSVTSAYGAGLLPVSPYVHVVCARLDCKEMQGLMTAQQITCVIDATHPYAVEATANIVRACGEQNIPYYRVVREADADVPDSAADLLWFDTLQELTAYLAGTDGQIFVTTGSKEMQAFCVLADYGARVTLRVLDVPEIVSMALKMGYDAAHVIARRGPFSVEDNVAQFRQSHARYLVTKDGGAAGGFPEKLQAAKQCGMQVLVLRRQKETGYSVSQIFELLQDAGKDRICVRG